jgi:hypothetical protein
MTGDKDDRSAPTSGADEERMQSPPVSRILFGVLANAVTIIHLDRRSLAGSSHLPAASPSRIDGRLFGVAPRRDCPFHPTRPCLVGYAACAPHPSGIAALRPPSLTRPCRRARRASSRSTRLCCSDPHLAVGRRYLLRRSAESGLSSMPACRHRDRPAYFAVRILGCGRRIKPRLRAIDPGRNPGAFRGSSGHPGRVASCNPHRNPPQSRPP